ncbi:hypothetical protein N658DRAFT_491022 [Parathielavia hyrcaniae]|uniref:Uncharacterized protein n=1 Tax=Parathielavia hyrcaniae TaxID=113614 RepID=A0AAN6T5Y3_9PEZI|nr:hypothetical protein N658DRAFT_491022 [Parathielavia hyrcaniae]
MTSRHPIPTGESGKPKPAEERGKLHGLLVWGTDCSGRRAEPGSGGAGKSPEALQIEAETQGRPGPQKQRKPKTEDTPKTAQRRHHQAIRSTIRGSQESWQGPRQWISTQYSIDPQDKQASAGRVNKRSN